MPPENVKGRPQLAQLEDGPGAQHATITTFSITGAGARSRSSRLPLAHASAFAPCPGRALWAFTYVCPACGFGHLGRAGTEADIAGPRRARCGRRIRIRVARAYRGRADTAEAA